MADRRPVGSSPSICDPFLEIKESYILFPFIIVAGEMKMCKMMGKTHKKGLGRRLRGGVYRQLNKLTSRGIPGGWWNLSLGSKRRLVFKNETA